MRILAFDCAGAQCAGAIVADGQVLAARRIVADRGHAQILLPLLRDILAEAGLAFPDVDRYAVTTGPGSFTGIRVALAAAQGLSLATGAPIIGVTVFDALAVAAVEAGLGQSGPVAGRLLVAVESKRAECFAQMFDAAGAAITPPRMLEPSLLGAWAGPGPLTLIGDAAERMAAYLPDATIAGGTHLRSGVDPGTLARIAGGRAAGGPPAPFYLRPPDAIPAALR
jgi:tRNA threonylcarbamoyladenosine biosynthesis protein TsaB